MTDLVVGFILVGFLTLVACWLASPPASWERPKPRPPTALETIVAERARLEQAAARIEARRQTLQAEWHAVRAKLSGPAAERTAQDLRATLAAAAEVAGRQAGGLLAARARLVLLEAVERLRVLLVGWETKAAAEVDQLRSRIEELSATVGRSRAILQRSAAAVVDARVGADSDLLFAAMDSFQARCAELTNALAVRAVTMLVAEDATPAAADLASAAAGGADVPIADIIDAIMGEYEVEADTLEWARERLTAVEADESQAERSAAVDAS